MSHPQTTPEQRQQQEQQQSDLEARIPDPEVVPKTKRRQFTAEYKLCILQEAERCTERGQIGALLRREGVGQFVSPFTARGAPTVAGAPLAC